MNDAPGTIVLRLLRLGLPIALGRAGVIAMGLTDLVVVGQLAGEDLPHLSLAYAVIGVVVHGGIALLLGVQVTSARAAGAGELPLAGVAWRRGLVLGGGGGALLLGLVALGSGPFYEAIGIEPGLARPATRIASILALSIPMHLAFIASTNFLEGLGRPTPGAIAMWAAVALNLVLNLLLVPVLGAEGSAWTTVASRTFLATAVGAFVLASPSARPVLGASHHTVSYGALARVGLAAMTSSVVEAGAFSAMGLIAARIGGDALATVNLATGGLLTGVAMMALGIGSASAILVARAAGEGNARALRRIGWTAIVFNALLFASVGALCVLWARPIAMAFTSNPGIVALFTASMGWVAVLMTPDCGQMVVDPTLRAAGDHRFPTVARAAAFVGVAPPLAYWLVEHRGAGVEGVFVALVAASGAAYVALLARWHRRAKRPARGRLRECG